MPYKAIDNMEANHTELNKPRGSGVIRLKRGGELLECAFRDGRLCTSLCPHFEFKEESRTHSVPLPLPIYLERPGLQQLATSFYPASDRVVLTCGGSIRVIDVHNPYASEVTEPENQDNAEPNGEELRSKFVSGKGHGAIEDIRILSRKEWHDAVIGKDRTPGEPMIHIDFKAYVTMASGEPLETGCIYFDGTNSFVALNEHLIVNASRHVKSFSPPTSLVPIGKRAPQ